MSETPSPPASADSIYLLPLGKLHTTRRFTMQDGGDDPVVLPVPAFLITSGDRRILVDTGMSPAGLRDPEGAWGKLATIFVPEASDEDTVEFRLSQVGFSPADITDVVLTHLHYDHAGGVSILPNAKRWVQLTEYRAAIYPERHYAGGYFPKEFGDGYDLLAGDATIAPGVHVLFTPGHTHGHQSVLVRIGEEWVCLTGDVVDDREILDRKRLPAVVVDIDAEIRSAARLRLLESALGARLIFSHDAGQHAALPELPDPIVARARRPASAS
jgi:N-acyl homoserine lactone hydrolase